MDERIETLASAAERELREDILPFWAGLVDNEKGGFYGEVSNDLKINKEASKGLVLNARILWAFSAAFGAWRDPLYKQLADRAYDYLIAHFWDTEYKGLFWSVDSEGKPESVRKQIYGQAFGVYALSMYYLATDREDALQYAIELFGTIENNAFEAEYGGYVEALDRDWSALADMRLSAIDLNVPYSQNTHLHLLEAYAALAQAWPQTIVSQRLKVVWEILAMRIRDHRSNRLILFQDRDWSPLSTAVSHGHDIEASWLLCETADVLGDKGISERTHTIALAMARDVLEHGFDRSLGGVSDAIDHDSPLLGKEWWTQAEAVVGFLNAFELSGDDEFLAAAIHSWDFIEKYLIDHQYGEWYYLMTPEGKPYLEKPKVSMWKCPYHNTRAMLQIIERAKRLNES